MWGCCFGLMLPHPPSSDWGLSCFRGLVAESRGFDPRITSEYFRGGGDMINKQQLDRG